MKITLLGTGNPAPSLTRMSPGYMVSVGNDVIVFDHGPGSHHRLLQTGTKPPTSRTRSSRTCTTTTSSISLACS